MTRWLGRQRRKPHALRHAGSDIGAVRNKAPRHPARSRVVLEEEKTSSENMTQTSVVASRSQPPAHGVRFGLTATLLPPSHERHGLSQRSGPEAFGLRENEGNDFRRQRSARRCSVPYDRKRKEGFRTAEPMREGGPRVLQRPMREKAPKNRQVPQPFPPPARAEGDRPTAEAPSSFFRRA